MSKPSSNSTIEAWVLAAQAGDKEAFGSLYEHFFDLIYRYVYFRMVPTEVDDVVETIFLKAWMNLDQYEKRDVQFSSWLFRIAHNAVIDHRRAHRSLELLSEDQADESDKNAPKTMAERMLLSGHVKEAVGQLKEPYRQVIMLKFLSGLSNAEIAEVLGQREGNIRVLQFRALKELKQILSKKGYDKSL